jgi:hypothetical protein
VVLSDYLLCARFGCVATCCLAAAGCCFSVIISLIFYVNWSLNICTSSSGNGFSSWPLLVGYFCSSA